MPRSSCSKTCRLAGLLPTVQRLKKRLAPPVTASTAYSLVPAPLFCHTSYLSFMLHRIHFSDSLELHCCGLTSAA